MNDERPLISIKDDIQMQVMIPECCREGWDTCKHVAKKERKQKQNIAL